MNSPKNRTQITIDDETKRLLEVLGKGNVSLGVRVAAKVAYDRYQHAPEAAWKRLTAMLGPRLSG